MEEFQEICNVSAETVTMHFLDGQIVPDGAGPCIGLFWLQKLYNCRKLSIEKYIIFHSFDLIYNGWTSNWHFST